MTSKITAKSTKNIGNWVKLEVTSKGRTLSWNFSPDPDLQELQDRYNWLASQLEDVETEGEVDETK